MASTLIRRKKDGTIPVRYQKMVASEHKDVARTLIDSSRGLPRVSAIAGLKPDFVDAHGCKYFFERKDPSDPNCDWYSVRVPAKSPNAFNPIISPPKLPVPVKEVRFFQLPNRAKGMCMGRICLRLR